MSVSHRSVAPSFQKGIHPAESKDLTRSRVTERMPFVSEYVLPLSQHIGAPSKPIVEAGERIRRGQLIAEPAGFVSTALHAPVTGRVAAIELRLHPGGRMLPSIVLEADPYSSQEITPVAPIEPQRLSRTELAQQDLD